MFEELRNRGFQIHAQCHAEAIMSVDFAKAESELQACLLSLSIPIEEIIASGGGEAKGTQRLRNSLSAKGWNKAKIEIQKFIDGAERTSVTHEIDHYKIFDQRGAIALEIEWNNKDPFFDRDLENFKRLHAEGAISVGVIVTRGPSLQAGMKDLVRKFVEERQVRNFEDLEKYFYVPTKKQKDRIIEKAEKFSGDFGFRDAFVDIFVSDKFGQATTHWEKLKVRIDRGVGNPCPMLFIGLPREIVTFDDEVRALADITSELDH